MTQLLDVNKNHKVLELGTGSGYQSSILSLLSRRVYTIERINSLLLKAENNFRNLKLTNIVTKFADGNLGWKEQVPFDRIIFTAATKKISLNFFNQVIDGGIVVAPIKDGSKQILTKYTKKNNQITVKKLTNVMFVPNLEGVKN